MSNIFNFKTEVWVPIYTGIKVKSIQEFIEALEKIPSGSILYHFYIHLFNYHNLPTDYPSSFCYWFSKNGCQVLAEKLSVIDPTRYYDLEILRKDILDILTKNFEKRKFSEPFYFIDVYREVIEVNKYASNIEELIDGINTLGISSLFYHLITSRVDKKKIVDDYSEWLINNGYAKKAEAIQSIDFYTLTLYKTKEAIIGVLK